MTALWVCEKYSVAADLARVLFGGIASHSSPVIETKKGVRLVYTTGHAVEPAAPEVYDAAYKSWEHQDVAGLVRGGFRLVPAPGKAGAVATIEKEIRKADELVVATDAGREGEMIARRGRRLREYRLRVFSWICRPHRGRPSDDRGMRFALSLGSSALCLLACGSNRQLGRGRHTASNLGANSRHRLLAESPFL